MSLLFPPVWAGTNPFRPDADVTKVRVRGYSISDNGENLMIFAPNGDQLEIWDAVGDETKRQNLAAVIAGASDDAVMRALRARVVPEWWDEDEDGEYTGSVTMRAAEFIARFSA